MNMATAPILPENMVGPLALIVGLLIIVLLIPRALKKKPADSGATSSRPADAASIRTREQIDDMIVKLDDIGREVYAKLDTKIRILNRLIEEADEKIRKLEALGAPAAPAPETKAKPAETKPDKPATGTASAPANPSAPEKGKYATVYALADAGQNVISIARQTGLQPGEIELLLELRRTKKTGSGK
jgi:hypothetical protein